MSKQLTKWREHEAAHGVLSQLGMLWEYRTLLSSEIDVPESRKNRARLGAPLDRDTVSSYTEAMRSGDVFPAIVVRHVGDRYVIIGGNHRHAAALELNPQNKFYVCCVECSDIEFDMLCRALNSVEGRGLSQEDRLLHGVEMVKRYGISVTQAAREMRVNPHTLQNRLAALEVQNMARLHGLDASVIPASSSKRMKGIASNPVIFVPLVKAIGSVNAGTKDIDRLVVQVNNAATEHDKLEVVEQWRRTQEQADGKRKGFRLKLRGEILRSVSKLESAFQNCASCTQTQLTESELSEVLGRLILIEQRMRHLLDGGSGQAGP